MKLIKTPEFQDREAKDICQIIQEPTGLHTIVGCRAVETVQAPGVTGIVKIYTGVKIEAPVIPNKLNFVMTLPAKGSFLFYVEATLPLTFGNGEEICYYINTLLDESEKGEVKMSEEEIKQLAITVMPVVDGSAMTVFVDEPIPHMDASL